MNNEENIPEIITGINCIHETKQHAVTIEHNWSINDICDLITKKDPGEKIESEQFSYQTSHTKPDITTNSTPTRQQTHLISTSLSLQEEIICDHFLNNAMWRLEINKSLNDAESISINIELLHHLIDLPQVLRNEINTSLIIKLKFYLFNSEMNQIFEREYFEVNYEIQKFFTNLLKCSEDERTANRTRLVEKFTVDNFCKINELLRWLDDCKSNDFCLVTEFKIYNQSNKSTRNFNTKSRLRSELNKFNSDLSSNSSSSSSSPSPPPHEPIINQQPSVLILNFKHAWTIINWRDFLMPAGQSSHTFISDNEISTILSKLNVESTPIQFGKFRSKLFNLKSTFDELVPESLNSEIEKLLNNVKWKLQLYPNGYSQEYENNLSLFVNFSQLTDDLAQFSQPVIKKKSQYNLANLKHNNSKVIEETFYDKDPNTGLILLIKSPSNGTTALEQSIDAGNFNFDSIDYNRKHNKKLVNLNETFVKASFQISILDSNGKRVDKCQSEKQLFELFGSWGYKEYMTAKDLIDLRDRYLTKSFTTLNLNCKIVLFYTITSKSNPISQFNEILTSNEIKPAKLAEPYFPMPNLVKEAQKQTDKPLAPLTECNTLLYDLRRLLKNSEMYDLIIQAPLTLGNDDEEFIDQDKLKQFKVHKLILSIRSEVFEKMFNNFNLVETSKSKILNIIDFEAFIVEIFLNYLYTDSLDIPNGSDSEYFIHLFIELFKISDKYCVHRLREICEIKLLKHVNVENTIELLILSYLHNSSRLKWQCFKCLTENVTCIISQPGWSHVERNYPGLLAESFRVLYFKQNQ